MTDCRPRSTHAPIAIAVIAMSLTRGSWAQLPAFDGDSPKSRPIDVPKFRKQGEPTLPADASPAMRVVRPDGSVERCLGGAEPPPVSALAVALAEGSTRLASPGTAVLVMTDGQRLVGAPDVDRGTVVWVSPWVAPRPIDLDRVRALVLPGGTETIATDEDVIELRNGDRVTGAVSSILPERVVVERLQGAEAERMEIDMKDVLSISFVGEDAEWSGARAWLSDGSVIDAPGMAWMGGNHIQLPGVPGARLPVATVPRRLVAAVQSSRGAAMPLAWMAATVAPPAGIPADRLREGNPPPEPAAGTWALDAPPLEIEGPVVVRYSGIDRPSRLMALVTRPVAARSAGSPDLVIRSAGREVLRERLQTDRASLEIRADLAAGPFEIELSSADGSIAGCFVVLEQALVLPTQPATDGR